MWKLVKTIKGLKGDHVECGFINSTDENIISIGHFRQFLKLNILPSACL